MGTPTPLVGICEGHIIRFRHRYRAAMADGHRSDAEAHELAAIAAEAMPDVRLLTVTVRHVNSCLGGADGMDSSRAVSGWEERQAARLWETEETTGRDEAA